MSWIYITFVLAICLTLSKCQNETKIRIIYEDMDMDDDNLTIVTLLDLTNYFKAYTDFLLTDTLDFSAFDLIWGLVYDDPRPVIHYIYNQWDMNITDGNLTASDALALFNKIDNWDSQTPDLIDYDWDFLPYFKNLYIEAEIAAADVTVGK